jgi:hypothetical protein
VLGLGVQRALRMCHVAFCGQFLSTSHSQKSPQHPILKHFLSVLISDISSASYSQTFPLRPNLNHSLLILFSNFPSSSYSQPSPQNLIHKHQLSIPISNISSVYHSQKSSNYHTLKHLSILKHTPCILFTNISSLSYSQTPTRYLILKQLRSIIFSNIYPILKHQQTTPISKHLGTLCSNIPLSIPFSHINNLQTNNNNQQLHI